MKEYKFWRPGPATLIAAAFIGPGTVTICTLAGVRHGLTLLWALLFSTFTTIVLQEMSARVGVVTKAGLGKNIRDVVVHPLAKTVSIILVLSAIFIGNAAYEAGNISGAILGIEALFPAVDSKIWSISIGCIALGLLSLKSYQKLEKILSFLVLIMSLSFVITAIIIMPSWQELLKGLLLPTFESDQLFLVIGIIGTTVVPYNLFLHASLVNKKWQNPTLSEVKRDTYTAIILGGIVSMAIVVCGSAVIGLDVNNAADMAIALRPSLGSIAVYFLSIGLFAAGITSAVTAPLAGAYATAGIIGWEEGENSWKFRGVWVVIIVIGVVLSSFNINPIQVINFAQVANGLLLPVMAIFLMRVVNDKKLLSNNVNTTWQNIQGAFVIVVTLIISYRLVAKIFVIT